MIVIEKMGVIKPKHPSKKSVKAECSSCECVFWYEESDCKVVVYRKYITCPTCKEFVCLGKIDSEWEP
jgi:hypothetical protein